MDFVMDGLATGRMLRLFPLLDSHTRECLAIEVDSGLLSRRVTRVLEWVIERRGAPGALRCDNGPEFTSRHLVGWCVKLETLGQAREKVESWRVEHNGGGSGVLRAHQREGSRLAKPGFHCSEKDRALASNEPSMTELVRLGLGLTKIALTESSRGRRLVVCSPNGEQLIQLVIPQ